MHTHSVLFVSHDATRSGAPTNLLHFLRWFKANGNRPFSVLLGGGGDLIVDFEEVADTWSMASSHWHPYSRWTQLSIALGLGKWSRLAEATAARKFAAKSAPALIYTNSIASARIIEMLAPDVPILTHVHELEFQFQGFRSTALSSLVAQTRQFIACSNAVRDNLIRMHRVAREQIETVYEAVPVNDIRAERSREQVFQELRIPRDALLIAAGGTLSWLKGTDLFIHLARAVCQRHSRAYFVWIGGGPPRDLAQFEHDVGLGGLTEKMRLTGATAKPADYLSAADVFVLMSREDSYPLVCLEAAALKKPIICFAGSGGAPEFVEGECGFVVPYLDTIAMAERVVFLLDSPSCRIAMGSAARRKVAQKHDVNESSPQTMEIIERTIKRS
jgi:glycosyltransferase involved in cell wall biosynthesis